MGSYLIAAPAQKMESCLINIVMYVFIGDFDVFLGEESLIASDEAKHFSVISKQAVNDVMSSWTLPAVKTNTDSNLFNAGLRLFRAEGNDLMTFLGEERILLLDVHF